jgi:hypothetical protein
MDCWWEEKVQGETERERERENAAEDYKFPDQVLSEEPDSAPMTRQPLVASPKVTSLTQ